VVKEKVKGKKVRAEHGNGGGVATIQVTEAQLDRFWEGFTLGEKARAIGDFFSV
jgi:hypothetical protein